MQHLIDEIKNARNSHELEEIRIKALGKKGILTSEFALLKDLEAEAKKERAKELNAIKSAFEREFALKKELLSTEELSAKLLQERVDLTLFNAPKSLGAAHPVMITMERIIDYFLSLNFAIKSGPLIEDDFHNFEALNLPKYHPARDMQDTFYFKDGALLRTHTSPVQIRTMEAETPPIRIIAPGAVFRRDYDLTHTPMFHQIEGLVVEEEGRVSFANLKYILEDFLKYMFGDVRVRFRTSFFPFTEPSAEADISCIFCHGDGCRVCSHTGWLEVLGCGLVDENVFKAVGYENVSGYAFGLGVERFAMLIHAVSDLRAFFENDLRVLEQFR
ncbi:MAG: phenylalanine--tRNA ligase subunit alpha [Wolinella sp.]